jgi:glucosamine--fructose-6-phosphate aminotransferase (isomerizing)
MCGIVGYLGPTPAASVLLSELKCLEYRGYDSAGVAMIENGQLMVLKTAGKLANLENLLNEKSPGATWGIGHTRWATHGIPNDQNAHPHTDCTGTIALVHNGIIENYDLLRDELIATGHTFHSETDTEVASHLIEEEYKNAEGDMILAIRQAAKRLKGAYALGIVSPAHPEIIYAVNQHYSLAVGIGDGECFLASDSVAVRQYTNKVIRLEQSEIAQITMHGVRLFSFEGDEVTRRPQVLDMNPMIMDKQGYRHYLHKEIHEQPIILRQTLSKYLANCDKPLDLSPAHMTFAPESIDLDPSNYGVSFTDQELRSVERVSVVACGTAYHAGLVGKYIIEELCGIPVDVEIASEIRGRRMLVNNKTLAIAVSQSGETADTIAALSEAKANGAFTLGITNRPDSHLARVTSNLIVTECGIEVSVAATKTFVAQVACFYLLAIYLAEKRGTIDLQKAKALKLDLLRVPSLQEKVLASEEYIKEKAVQYSEAKAVVFIGRGLSYPIALEGALKLKELSYIHASGYAAGELKHGPIAVLDSQMPVITILIPGSVYDKTLSNAQEAKARHAKMIAVAQESDPEAKKTFETILPIPAVSEFLSPMVSVLPLQLFSYFVADYLGKDVDQPRNLAKSVTVE